MSAAVRVRSTGCWRGGSVTPIRSRPPTSTRSCCARRPLWPRRTALASRITFREGNAVRLPFADASFDHAYSVTVLEECDADIALRELFRVVRPGGRVGVIVRAIDMPQWWHLDLPDSVRHKVDVPPQSVAPHGVADASLYRRMAEAGFEALTCFPTLVTFDRPDGPIWRYREDHVLPQLNEAETAVWRAADRRGAGGGIAVHGQSAASRGRPQAGRLSGGLTEWKEFTRHTVAVIFNSYQFLFAFLPIVLAGTFVLARFGANPARIWLIAASLFFYAAWNAAYLPLLARLDHIQLFDRHANDPGREAPITHMAVELRRRGRSGLARIL